ncbi:MAG: SprB repeat-containing protein, partial [Chitinophagales bacterium]
MNHFFYKLLLLFVFLCTSIFVSAQPLPCEDPPTMTPLCADACIICDIDGFTGVNNGGASGEAPADFCTSTVHNGRWIAFIAGSESLVIELSVANCQFSPPEGLELGIYEGNNCGNFNLITECDGSIDENTSAIFTTNTPLTIGQYYYIVMDGNHGDVCEWTFKVLEGSTKVNPLETSGVISGDLETCVNRFGEYSTTGQVGATEFLWTVDGEIVQDGFEQTLEIEWQNEGTYELCVTAFNACDEAPPSCETIVVSSIPITLLEEEICNNQSFVLNDTIAVNTAGTHEFDFIDSNGCDSTVVLTLDITNCAIKGTIGQTPARCFGEASGQLDFMLTMGTPPFAYTWTQIGTNTMGSGTVENVNESVNISGLLAGTYSLVISDFFGNDLTLTEELTQSPQINVELTALDFNGFNVSCFEDSNGSLKVLSSGGALPHRYFWSTGENDVLEIENL